MTGLLVPPVPRTPRESPLRSDFEHLRLDTTLVFGVAYIFNVIAYPLLHLVDR